MSFFHIQQIYAASLCGKQGFKVHIGRMNCLYFSIALLLVMVFGGGGGGGVSGADDVIVGNKCMQKL